MEEYELYDFDQLMEKIKEVNDGVNKTNKQITAAQKKNADADVSDKEAALETYAEEKKKILAAIKPLKEKRDRREEEEHKARLEVIRTGTTTTPTPPSSSTEPKWSMQSATTEMRADAQATVHEFDPNTCNIADFLTELSRVYNIYIEGEKHGDLLIPAFIRMIKSKLTPNTLDSLRRENQADFATFQEAKDTLYEKYATIRTPYQLLQNVWKVEREDNESVGDMCTRLQQKMSHAATSIAASFKKKYDRDMSLKEQADMFAGMRLLEMIQVEYPEVHTQLVVNKIDDLYDSQGIAAAATKLIARLGEAPSTTAAGYYQAPGGNRQQHRQHSGYKGGRDGHAVSGGGDLCPYDPNCFTDCGKRHPIRNAKIKKAWYDTKKKSVNNGTTPKNGSSSTQSTKGNDQPAQSFNTAHFRL